jgi:hypothetical protein
MATGRVLAHPRRCTTGNGEEKERRWAPPKKERSLSAVWRVRNAERDQNVPDRTKYNHSMLKGMEVMASKPGGDDPPMVQPAKSMLHAGPVKL